MWRAPGLYSAVAMFHAYDNECRIARWGNGSGRVSDWRHSALRARAFSPIGGFRWSWATRWASARHAVPLIVKARARRREANVANRSPASYPSTRRLLGK